MLNYHMHSKWGTEAPYAILSERAQVYFCTGWRSCLHKTPTAQYTLIKGHIYCWICRWVSDIWRTVMNKYDGHHRVIRHWMPVSTSADLGWQAIYCCHIWTLCQGAHLSAEGSPDLYWSQEITQWSDSPAPPLITSLKHPKTTVQAANTK